MKAFEEGPIMSKEACIIKVRSMDVDLIPSGLTFSEVLAN